MYKLLQPKHYMRFSLPKNEKLKSKKEIERLFEKGHSVSSFPIRLVYSAFEERETPTKVAFSVPKRHFKLAVTRNRIKRLMREAYRLKKNAYFNNTTTPYALMFLYLGKKEPSLAEINSAISKVLETLKKTTL